MSQLRAILILTVLCLGSVAIAQPGSATIMGTPEFSAYRRVDGTLNWSRMMTERSLRNSNELIQFTLAMFLKEVVFVVQTGDRKRLDEFFDGLLETDFYRTYGLSVAGDRIGEVAYERRLRRYVKPRFLAGALKSKLMMTTSMALPLLVEGQFEGRAFAISLTSLGLSTAAVKNSMAQIRWVTQLAVVEERAPVLRFATRARSVMGASSWVYKVAETVVIAYVAEELEERITDELDLRAARKELALAGQYFLVILQTEGLSVAQAQTALTDYRAAWIAYRDFLYQQLHTDERHFAEKIKGVAHTAQLAATRREAAIKSLPKKDALYRFVLKRHGSIRNYTDHLVREEEQEVQTKINQYLHELNTNREKLILQIFQDGRRDHPLLRGLSEVDWLDERSDADKQISKALKLASENRLQAYNDEIEILNALSSALKTKGRNDIAAALEQQIILTGKIRKADANLMLRTKNFTHIDIK